MQFKDTILNIELPSYGVYFLGIGKTGEGRTYVKQLLDEYVHCTHDSNVLTVTYDSKLFKDEHAKAIKGFQGEYLMLDRADRYLSLDLCDLLLRKAEHAYVLVDCKNIQFWNKLRGRFCQITIKEDCVMVEPVSTQLH